MQTATAQKIGLVCHSGRVGAWTCPDNIVVKPTKKKRTKIAMNCSAAEVCSLLALALFTKCNVRARAVKATSNPILVSYGMKSNARAISKPLSLPFPLALPMPLSRTHRILDTAFAFKSNNKCDKMFLVTCFKVN